jgi:hypothetical protein
MVPCAIISGDNFGRSNIAFLEANLVYIIDIVILDSVLICYVL